jgi:hypothetical protein
MSESNSFCCSICKFSTILNGNLQKHFLSKKHIKNIESPDTQITDFQCEKCNKYYKGKSGLRKHTKKCANVSIEHTVKPLTNIQEKNMNQEILDAMNKISEQIKQSNELSKQSAEETKKSQEQMNIRLDKLSEEFKQNQQQLVSTTINNNNNTTINNTFNMNIFLNEKCGQAINFDDFIKHIIFENADASKMIGSYVEGTCNIIQRNLEELPLNRRPLHYLVGEDPYQQLLHIRQDDQWNMTTELNWMQQIHSDDDDLVVDKNPIYYALKKIDDDKLGYLAYYFNQNKEYKLQHGRLVREISRPDFKEIVYRKVLNMVVLDTDKLENIDVKSKIQIM